MTGTMLDYYAFEACTRLSPVQEERMRAAISETERLAFLNAVERDRPRIIDAWITQRPAPGQHYLAHAHALRTTFPHAPARARRRRIWWLPWRKGGGRG